MRPGLGHRSISPAQWPDLDFTGLDEVWWGGAIESWPSLAARCADLSRPDAPGPDRDQVAVISHWGFIRGLTGAELHNTEFHPAQPRRDDAEHLKEQST